MKMMDKLSGLIGKKVTGVQLSGWDERTRQAGGLRISFEDGTHVEMHEQYFYEDGAWRGFGIEVKDE